MQAGTQDGDLAPAEADRDNNSYHLTHVGKDREHPIDAPTTQLGS